MSTQIIIAGAGPVGLLAAITLVTRGIEVRIFEKEKERSNFSRALAIHAGTLEFLEVVHPQLLKKILARGKKIQKIKIGEKYRIDLSLIPSKYNSILVLGQQETERLLEEYLIEVGGKIERGYELFDVKDSGRKITASLRSGVEIFNVESDYLIDCSGAHSVIRKNILKLSFHGEKYLGKIVMGDVKVKNLPSDSGQVYTRNNSIAAFIPIDDEDFFRVILFPHEQEKIPQTIPINYFRDLAKSIAPQVEIREESRWLTSFKTSKRMVTKLRVGRVFLAGDAAHIHSPVGGQGMNLGMHDALNLSLKFKRVLIGKESEKILDDYNKERMPVIKEVLRNTHAATRLGVEDSLFSLITLFILRQIFVPIFFRSKFLQRKLFTLLSQLKAARTEIKRIK